MGTKAVSAFHGASWSPWPAATPPPHPGAAFALDSEALMAPRAPRWSRVSSLASPHLPARLFSACHHVPLLCPCPCAESARRPSRTTSRIPGQGALSEGCVPLRASPFHLPWVPSPHSSRPGCRFAKPNPVCGFSSHANRHPPDSPARTGVCQWELSPLNLSWGSGSPVRGADTLRVPQQVPRSWPQMSGSGLPVVCLDSDPQ